MLAIRNFFLLQVTELVDGVFIGCSMNHVVGDGTSYWNFWNTWSYIHQQHSTPASLPVLERWFPQGHGPRIALPFTSPDEFVSRYEVPRLRERMFNFPSHSISKLKKRANMEVRESDKEISSLQALAALLWKSITRARCLEGDEKVICSLDANLRQRLNPPVPEGYFGNLIWVAKTEATADELLKMSLGSAAGLIKKAVSDLTDEAVRRVFETWMKSSFVYQSDAFMVPNCVVIGSSPRFNVLGNEFELGKPMAVRSGCANKFSGKLAAFSGQERGSIDVEVCLTSDEMSALESDQEFMALVA